MAARFGMALCIVGCQRPSAVASTVGCESKGPTDIALFVPAEGAGYVDLPMNGETEGNQARSYLRCDLQTLVKEAAASVAMASFGWPESNGMPLVLGDMSLADGSVPLLSDGVTAAHNAGSHTGGLDIDVGYFQTANAPDNQLRAVCDIQRDGQPEYHCTDEPGTLDLRQTALFVSLLSEAELIRCIGVDGRIGPMIERAQDELASAAIGPRSPKRRLCYETEDTGRGWYLQHYNHMHISARPD